MRKYFDHAYEGWCNSFEPFIRFVELMIEAAKILFVYITIPVWIVPYVCFFRKEEETEE